MPSPPDRAPRSRAVPRMVSWGVLVAGALCIVAWQGALTRSSLAAHVSIGATIGALAVACVAGGRGRQRARSADWARAGAAAAWHTISRRGARPALAVAVGTALWALLAAVTLGWDLNSFAHQVHSLPTLSRLVGDVTRHDWGRSVVFAAWLALGSYLALGWRRPVARPQGEREGSPGR